MLAKFEGALSASGFSTRPATDPGAPLGTTTPYLEISGPLTYITLSWVLAVALNALVRSAVTPEPS